MRSFSVQKVPVPANFFALEKRPGTQKLVIEIGCGVGMHALRFAKANSDCTLVAIERTEERFTKFQRRIMNHAPLPNLVAIRGDAVHWLSHALPSASVDKYFLLYPNPYPKESQANLRWHNMPFFGRLVDSMKPAATLVLASNLPFYIEEAAERIPGKWGLQLVSRRLVSAAEKPLTHFEKKYLERGEPCEHLLFTKPC